MNTTRTRDWKGAISSQGGPQTPNSEFLRRSEEGIVVVPKESIERKLKEHIERNKRIEQLVAQTRDFPTLHKILDSGNEYAAMQVAGKLPSIIGGKTGPNEIQATSKLIEKLLLQDNGWVKGVTTRTLMRLRAEDRNRYDMLMNPLAAKAKEIRTHEETLIRKMDEDARVDKIRDMISNLANTGRFNEIHQILSFREFNTFLFIAKIIPILATKSPEKTAAVIHELLDTGNRRILVETILNIEHIKNTETRLAQQKSIQSEGRELEKKMTGKLGVFDSLISALGLNTVQKISLIRDQIAKEEEKEAEKLEKERKPVHPREEGISTELRDEMIWLTKEKGRLREREIEIQEEKEGGKDAPDDKKKKDGSKDVPKG